ncbi:YcnI family protein [Gordonia sp. DT30]|uniref:YcnI family copper-binding membrane protein n=1 Tax=Gordonia sp. DT30 TaxID=3416546 RepID=UPI003CF8963E
MSTTRRTWRHTPRRVMLVVATLCGLAMLTAAPAASAHVTVDPGTSPTQGRYGQVRLLVPSEDDNSPTVGVTATIPDGVDLTSVRTLPIPGWTATIDRTETTGSQRISRITWQAATPENGLRPSEFGQFTFSGGPWPKNTTSISLPTEQRYGNGTIVSWNEVAAAGQPEPEHPAPVVTLAPAAAGEHGAVDAHGAEEASIDEAATQSDGSSSSSSGWWQAVSVVGVALALAALVGIALLWRRSGAAAGRTAVVSAETDTASEHLPDTDEERIGSSS